MSGVARGQRQIMHQLDNLSNLLRENLGERLHHGGRQHKTDTVDIDPIKISVILTSLAIGGLGIFLFKGFLPQK